MLDKMNEQILNKMNGQDLLEFLRRRKTIGRVRYRGARSDTVFQRRTLSRNVRHCEIRSSSNSFDTVSLYHTVPRAGKRYFTGCYESVLIITILHYIKMTAMSKLPVNFSPQNNTHIISSLNTSKLLGLLSPSLYFRDSVLKKSFRLFTI